MKRIWYLSKGNHLCGPRWNRLPFGTGSDEFGHKTWWIRLPVGGVLVLSSKKVYYPEDIDA